MEACGPGLEPGTAAVVPSLAPGGQAPPPDAAAASPQKDCARLPPPLFMHAPVDRTPAGAWIAVVSKNVWSLK